MRTNHHVVGTGRLNGYPAVGIKRQLRPNSRTPHHLTKIGTEESGVICTTSNRPWIVEQDTQDQSMDREARASRHEEGYLFGRDKSNHARAEYRRRTPSELRHDSARYRGATHPLCFTDDVLDHEFPEGFKPVNIES